MKIAIIQPRTSYYIAGSEKVSIKHAEYFARIGHTVDLYTSKPKGVEYSFLFNRFLENKHESINLLQFDISKLVPGLYKRGPDLNHNRWITESFAFNQIIHEELVEKNPDIMLSYYLPDGLFKPISIPNVLYLAGYPSNPVSWYKVCMHFFDSTIAISEMVSNQWKKNTGTGKKHFVLGTGVDYPVDFENKIEPKAEYNLVFAGRLLERKGLLTLIDAFSRVIEKNKKVHLWILGGGNLNEKIKEKIEHLNLLNYITMTGIVENPQDYFNMADVCVFPSHKGDGLMGTVLESMAIGKPVISTKRNGNEDIITTGENGILVEPDDVGELTSVIENVLANPEKRKMLGENAEIFIRENIVWEKNIEKLSSLLEEITESI